MTDRTLPSAPVARKDHREIQLHGVTLVDDYGWLRDKDAPEVTEYLNAENAYSDALTADLAPLRDELYKEMLSHIKQTDESAPYREGDWWYYSRTEEGKQYSIFCRKRGSSTAFEGPEEVVLDGNKLAEGQAFFAIGSTDISDDGRWLAYTTDVTGFRQYALHIKDLQTGETHPDPPSPGLQERVGSLTWTSDNKTLFYTIEDEEQKRQFQLYRHTLKTPYSDDVLVYQDDDARFNVGVGRTRDGKYVVLESASHTTTECQILLAENPTGEFRTIAERENVLVFFVVLRFGLLFFWSFVRGCFFW